MARKRIKAYETDIYNLSSAYHDFYRVKDDKGNRGTAFIFSKLLQDDIEKISQYKNVIVSQGTYKYALEIHNIRIILLDKCIK